MYMTRGRRGFLAIVGAAALAGCSTLVEEAEESEQDEDDSDDEGLRSSKPLRVVNSMDESISVYVSADADGDSILSDRFELEEGLTTEIIGGVPEGSKNLTIGAEVDFSDENKEEQRTFELPKEYDIGQFRLTIRGETISMEAISVPELHD